MTIAPYFMADIVQLTGLLAVLAVLAGFAVIGAAITGSSRFAPADIFVGWGLVCTVFIVGGVFGGIGFTWLAAGLIVALVPAAVFVKKNLNCGAPYPSAVDRLWKILLLSLPLLLLVSAMKASQWDEFAHWLPNAQYIFRHDGFPGGDMPPILSAHPAYPYGLPMVTYLASKLGGNFIENAAAMANVALLVILAPVYISVIRHGLGQSPAWSRRWSVAALGILGVTAFSTTFVQKLIFTAYGDATTSVVLAVAGVLGWKILETLTDETDAACSRARSLAWQFAWVAVVLLSIKQSNLALFGLLLLAVGTVASVDRKIKTATFFRLMPIMVGPGLVVYLAWRYHVWATMPDGEIALLPFAQWHLSHAGNILANMFGVATDKGAFFIMMTAITVGTVYGLGRGKPEFARLGLITATVFICFNVFLWIVYIAAFKISNSLGVVSFWRFNTQLGLLGCTTAAYGVAILWRHKIASSRFMSGRLVSAIAIVTVLTAPLLGAKTLRFDIRPQKDHIRMVGQEMAATLPVGSRLKVIDPNGNGLATTIIRYEMKSAQGAGKNFSIPAGLDNYSGAKAILETSLTHAWVFQSTAAAKDIFDLPLAASASHLLEKDGDNWRIIKSWPYGTFKDPYRLPD